jgi:exodeoxyribonuclease VII large subunit
VAARRRDLRALRAELADPARLLSQQRHRLDDLLHRSMGGARERLRSARAGLSALQARLGRRDPLSLVRALARRTVEARRRLDAWRAETFRREALRLERLERRLEPANVAKLLSRGFALVLAGGRLVRESGQAGPGEGIRVALGKGWLDARVTARDAGPDPLPGRGDGAAGGPDPEGHVDPLPGGRY